MGILDGKLVVRGPRKILAELKLNGVLKELTDSGGVFWVEEGATPSEWIIALDFDKTLAKNFLWAELGGLQGAAV